MIDFSIRAVVLISHVSRIRQALSVFNENCPNSLPPANFIISPRKKTPAKSPAVPLVTPGVLKPMAFNFDERILAEAKAEAKRKRVEEEKKRLAQEEPLLKPNSRRWAVVNRTIY